LQGGGRDSHTANQYKIRRHEFNQSQRGNVEDTPASLVKFSPA
jgi:hypothetical protein